jgi:hypothetical protein
MFTESLSVYTGKFRSLNSLVPDSNPGGVTLRKPSNSRGNDCFIVGAGLTHTCHRQTKSLRQ